jgi:hypothetical protein
MMHRLSCENGNESSHEAEEEEMAVSASTTTMGTPNDSSVGGTESHQPPTRHRRDADDVSPLLLGTLRSTSTLAAETNGSGTGMTGSYDVTASTMEIVTMNNVTPEEINITTQEFTAPVVVSAGDGLTLTRNHEQQFYTTTDPSTKAATKTVSTEYFITIVPYNASVTDKDMMQKMTVDKPHQDQCIEKTEIIEGISSTPAIIPPTGLSTVKTAVETSATSGILNEVKEITISFTEGNITKNSTEETEIKDEILLTETVSETTGTNTVSNTTVSSSSTENINISDEESIKPNGKESPVLTKHNTGTDDQIAQNFKEEDHRLQFLPASLRGLPHNTDNQTNETGTKSTSDWALPSDQQDDGEQFQPAETEPEVPARPNRGRRLIRPQSHSFYPYFLNRVLG